MRIGEMSERVGLSNYTLRYYEKIGVIPPVHRDQCGIRDYTETDFDWIQFIQCMKKSGMTIQALIQYTRLWQEGKDTADLRKKLLKKQQKELTAKLTSIEQLGDTL